MSLPAVPLPGIYQYRHDHAIRSALFLLPNYCPGCFLICYVFLQEYVPDRKGFDYFLESLKILESCISEEQRTRIVIVVVSRDIHSGFEGINFEKKVIDYITDYRLLILLYQAIDLFVNSSVEDGGPMMVSEALACGTPVVGFDMGVVNNLVINDFNGYKAELMSAPDLSAGIKKIFELSKMEALNYSVNAEAIINEQSSFEYASKIFNEIIYE